MNIFKRSNFLALTWAIEALNQEVEEENEPSIDFAVGGQAVIEGVMMRSPNSITIAVRKQSGEIKVDKKPYQTLTQKYSWLNIPILRGVVNLFEMMIIGTNAINFSANESLEEPESKKSKKKKSEFQKKLAKFAEGAMFALSFVFAMALSLSLFKFIPFWTATFIESRFSVVQENYMLFNLIDGVIKMSIFLTYIFLLSLIPDFRKIFEYHGAEHKSIYAYENKKELNVENAKKQIRFHPRCGTSFILIVFLVSIVFYTFIPKLDSFWTSFALRVAVLPFIAGISYEYLKFSAKHQDNAFVKALIAPGLWFQRLTTKEPDEKQLAVGLQSLKEALAMEKLPTS
jgi:uncharacterized protein YqhQ